MGQKLKFIRFEDSSQYVVRSILEKYFWLLLTTSYSVQFRKQLSGICKDFCFLNHRYIAYVHGIIEIYR